jgi:riboflavin kinase / FMN adenylyltransferase
MRQPPGNSAKDFRVVRDLDAAAHSFTGAVVAIGNFDGVHRGHRAVIETACGHAKALGRQAVALTFEPHPRSYFRPEEPMFRLTDEGGKLRLLRATGLAGAIVLPFDGKLASLSAEEFVAGLLVEKLNVAAVSVGFDFHFGKGRAGSPAFLAEQGEARGFVVDIVSARGQHGRPVSSTAIREALSAGSVADAADLLGYPWFVTRPVTHGEKRGRELGFPTANLKLDPGCQLRHGIYAVRVGFDGARHDGVASFGRRPTFDDGAPLLEVHLFDFDGDLYGRMLDVAFIGWIRPELKFDSVDALVARMNEDARDARAVLAAKPGMFPPI